MQRTAQSQMCSGNLNTSNDERDSVFIQASETAIPVVRPVDVEGSVHSLPGRLQDHAPALWQCNGHQKPDEEGSTRNGSMRWRGPTTEGSVHSRISDGSVRLSSMATLAVESVLPTVLPNIDERNHGASSALDAVQGSRQQHIVVTIEQADTRWRWAPRRWATAYTRKFKGGLDHRLPLPAVSELLLSTFGAFVSILAIAGLNEWLLPRVSTTLLIPSLGATAVLVFGAPESKLAQPRNVICGQVLSALIGIAARNALGGILWLSAPIGMSCALLAMMVTATTHPPGGATALVAASAEELAPGYGFMYLAAITLSTTVMLLIALLFNNLLPKRTYPRYWWGAPGVFK